MFSKVGKIIRFTLPVIASGMCCNIIFSAPVQANSTPDSTITAAGDSTKEEAPLKSKITYSAKDSISFNVEEQQVYLYGDAVIHYEDIELKAAKIIINWAENTLYAEGMPDSTGRMAGLPVFSEAEKSFNASNIKYNFKTKKGKITQVTTHEGEGYIHGEVVKKDSGNDFYIRNGKYTTCESDTPHYYIRAGKLKVIQNDKIITGPAYLVIEEVPTPLFIPFGYFPNRKGRSSGILIPVYGESKNLGFFLRNGGYYWGISDYMDLSLRGDIYSKGSWGVNAASGYAKKYRYNGTVNLSYSTIKSGERELPSYTSNTNFFIRWNHARDAKARPGSRFSANVNAGSSSFFRNTLTSNPSDYLSSTFQSSIAYSKSWAGKPYNLSVNMRHSQNTLNKTVDLSVPDVAFNVNRFYPFKNNNRAGEATWYDKIGISYSVTSQNSIQTYDSLLFKKESLDKMRNGMRHSLPLSTSFKVFKYFSLSPVMNNTWRWYLRSIRKTFDQSTGSLRTDTVNSFKTAYDFSVSASLNTRMYGMFQFKNAKIVAIRHVLNPSLGVSYRPDFSKPAWKSYETVQKDTLGNALTYTYFEQGIYGAPPSGKSGFINFALDNNLEMKVRAKNDTVTGTKKIKLLESLSFASGYNIAADSMNFSSISMNGRTTLFNKLNATFSASYDPYALDSIGRRINKYEWDAHRRLARLTNAGAAFSFNLNHNANKPKESTLGTEIEMKDINLHPENYVDFNVPWNLSVSYSLNLAKSGIQKKQLTQSLNFNGDLNLTPKWKVGFNSGYDFISHKFTYTSVDIYRDLHCWEMKFNWIPFGFHQSYNFQIKVKSSVLQDLRLIRKRDWYDK